MRRAIVRALIIAAVLCTGLAHAGDPAKAWKDARQLVLVTTPDWTAIQGSLSSYVREDGRWHRVAGPLPVVVGAAGAGWGLGLQPPQAEGPQKREGDNRSPAGVFRLGTAFGYAPGARTALPYLAADAGDYCIDVAGSPLYNRIVNTHDVGEAAVRGATEPMRRDLAFKGDQAYRRGFVIEQNPQNRPGGGSCVFAHLWRSPATPTAGCTAMTDAAMEQLLAWLDPKEHPVFVLLPQAAYRKLRGDWRLP